ncbi:hypothetical protein N9F18_00485 [bacterium]|nr:hypothetical protein [bacterium]
MNKFELLLDRLIESEMQRKDLALSNQKLGYQYRELDKNSRIEINLLNSKITDYEYIIQSKAEPKTK